MYDNVARFNELNATYTFEVRDVAAVNPKDQSAMALHLDQITQLREKSFEVLLRERGDITSVQIRG